MILNHILNHTVAVKVELDAVVIAHNSEGVVYARTPFVHVNLPVTPASSLATVFGIGCQSPPLATPMPIRPPTS